MLGRTLDDAAGEAFDKGARMLGLGYPGGAALERLAADGDPEAFSFPGSRGERRAAGAGAAQAFARGPRLLLRGGQDRAAVHAARALRGARRSARAADLAASYQAAIVDSLIVRAERALERTGIERLAVGGGVAANGELRRRLGELGATVHVPARALCTDNAAMIASAARYCERLRLPASTSRSTPTRPAERAASERRVTRLLQARLPSLRGGDGAAARLQARARLRAAASSTSPPTRRSHRAYFERIPVIELDGEELCEYFVEEALVRERLESRR